GRWPTRRAGAPFGPRGPTRPAGRSRCAPRRRPAGWRPCVRPAWLALKDTECQPEARLRLGQRRVAVPGVDEHLEAPVGLALVHGDVLADVDERVGPRRADGQLVA